MDPTENLTKQITLATRVLDQYDHRDDGCVNPDDAAELAELVHALHEWLTRDGYLPLQWRNPNRK